MRFQRTLTAESASGPKRVFISSAVERTIFHVDENHLSNLEELTQGSLHCARAICIDGDTVLAKLTGYLRLLSANEYC